MNIEKIELLAPAANLLFGKAAISAGADAVYIGGPGFGARKAAGNSVEDIAALVHFAHGYGAKVYVAMNTLLFDDEIASAQNLVHELYRIGVDALIVQDMAFLKMDLPPIALHASTQSFNLTPERVSFLSDAGFSRVILERGASLDAIRRIRSCCDVQIEAFVHGAICVSYSGQCYLGQSLCNRGGNRGACAQACRSRYNLQNERGERLLSNAHLLSTKDLNLSQDLDELLDAGVCSLKIEGRLKELSYVVNNTAYYHQKLEELGAQRTSSGMVNIGFEPDPIKSFSRGFTQYNLHGAALGWGSGNSTRSIGEPIGTVVSLTSDYAIITGGAGVLSNGDGICFVDSKGVTRGTNINTVQSERVYLNNMEGVEKGVAIYRNHDKSFSPDEKSVDRTIAVYPKIRWSGGDNSLTLSIVDQDGFSAQITTQHPLEPAKNASLALSNLRAAMLKTGGTIFQATEVDIQDDAKGFVPFIANSSINDLRRKLLDKLLEARIKGHHRDTRKAPTLEPLTAPIELDFRANISNSLARKFYQELGFITKQQAAELEDEKFLIGRPVMRTPYCIRREIGCCLQGKPFEGTPSLPQLKIPPTEQLFIENNGQRFKLQFHCQSCEMTLIRI